MNTMSMPGFSAEASLYKTSAYYRHLSNGSMQANKGVIQSAFTRHCGNCYLDDTGACMQDCWTCIDKPTGQICTEPEPFPCRNPNGCSPQCGPCTCTQFCTKNCGGNIVPC
jgi:hypothetical protein